MATVPAGNVRRVARSSTVLTIGSIGNRLFEMAAVVLLGSYLSEDDFGRYASLFIYFGFCALLVDMGMNSILQRETARNPEHERELLNTGITVGFFTSILIILLSYPLIRIIYPPEVSELFWYGALFVVVSSRSKSLRKMLEVPFIVHFRVRYIPISAMLDRFVVIILLYIFVNLAVIIMRESKIQNYQPIFRAPLYPWLQILGVLSGLELSILS